MCVYKYIYFVEKTSIWYLDLPIELLTLKLGLGQLIGVVESSKISQNTMNLLFAIVKKHN